MPLFYFILKSGRHVIPDIQGEEFEDEAAACAHARVVAWELMRNREAKTSHWRIQVCDDYLQPRHEYLFADLDSRLEYFGTDVRDTVAAVARSAAARDDTVREIDASFAELRQTIDRIDSILSRSQ